MSWLSEAVNIVRCATLAQAWLKVGGVDVLANAATRRFGLQTASGAVLVICLVGHALSAGERTPIGDRPSEEEQHEDDYGEGIAGLAEAIPLHRKVSRKKNPDQGGPVEIGLNKQLLVDDYAVAEKVSVTRELGIVTRENGGNPVMVADQPWEHANRLAFYMTVLRDDPHGKFKMWYLAQHGGWTDLNGFHTKVGKAGVDLSGVGYAESTDGINWTKPAQDVFTYDDIVRETPAEPDAPTNIVIQAQSFSCFIDPTVPRGALDKYKAAMDNPNDQRKDGGDVACACLAYSPDGIHWTYYNDGQRVTYRAADTQNQLLWDDIASQYLLVTRQDLAGDGEEQIETRGTRLMAHHQDNNLLEHPTAWRDVQILGFDDPLRRQIHAMTVWPYEGVYFGFISSYEFITQDGFSSTPADLESRHEENIVNFYIATSRDLVDWDLSWALTSQPLIPRGAAGSFDKDGIHVPNLVTYDDRHYLYYCGMSERFGHDDPRGAMGVGLATLRLDGFVCLQANEEPGTVVTKPFKLEGKKLQVNVDASRGDLSLEILDADGNRRQGFSGSRAPTYRGIDELRFEPTWPDRDLSELEGETIQLKFNMRNAKLYAFQIK